MVACLVAGDEAVPVLAGVYQVEAAALVSHIEAVVVQAEGQGEALTRDGDPLELLAGQPVVDHQGLVL